MNKHTQSVSYSGKYHHLPEIGKVTCMCVCRYDVKMKGDKGGEKGQKGGGWETRI